jgi:hypothetical protein
VDNGSKSVPISDIQQLHNHNDIEILLTGKGKSCTLGAEPGPGGKDQEAGVNN